MNSNILTEWINPIYLNQEYINNLRETIKSKPEIKYLTLDHFFIEDKINSMIEDHKKLSFSEKLDRYSHNGDILPYDSSLYWMNNLNVGYELLFSNIWFKYLLNFFSKKNIDGYYTEVKIRKHRENSNGFWIHTDSKRRKIVFICYYNRNWTVEDGGLLQLWRVDECNCEKTIKVEHNCNNKMDYLNNVRLNVRSPGGGFSGNFSDGNSHDLVLIDQILPLYNRIFLCDLSANETYHSVTPTKMKERNGFVQWIYS